MEKVYLAIPYSGMVESSYEQATEAAVNVLNMGYNVFSPITHSHPLTLLDKYEVPHTWDYWQNIDFQFIDWADEIWVVIPKEGLERVVKSTGVVAELNYGQKHYKVIRFCQMKDGGLHVYEPNLIGWDSGMNRGDGAIWINNNGHMTTALEVDDNEKITNNEHPQIFITNAS